MSAGSIRLVIGDLEAEVLQEALELYLNARPPRADRRYEYRYRAAQAVLDSLWQQGDGLPVDGPPSDDELVVRTGLWDNRNVERLED